MKSWFVPLLSALILTISFSGCKKDDNEGTGSPKSPSGLIATPSSSSEIDLSWTDNSDNETGFKIERSPNNSNWTEIATVSAGKTTYQNTGLAASTTYYFRVRAYNSAGNSAYTSSVSGKTLAAVSPVPTAPTNLTATVASSTQINLGWTDNSNDETGFRIERSADGSTGWSEIATTASNTTTYQNTGLTACTIYYYRVRAYNASGNSSYSNNANATTASASAPTAPSNLTATAASSSQINLSWTDNSNNETGFKVERSPDGSTGWTEIATPTANTTTYQNTGLTASTTYYYRVRAYNASGNSGYSNTANATTTGTGPAAPSALTATAASSSQINLSWTDNSNNETGFKVERSPDGSTGWTEIATPTANTTTYQNTGLTASTTYYYRVRAYNGSGNSGYSNTANATTSGTLPAAPSALTATAASSSQINLSWTDNSNNETGFKVERSPDGSTGWTEIATPTANTTTYQNTGLTASTTYYYRVRAYNGSGNSGYSNTANATTQGIPPAAPTNLIATAVSSSQINLSWTDNSSNETGFKVERSPDGSTGWTEIATPTANTTTYQNTGLASSTIYYYRVRAYNTTGNSAYTSVANATTFTAVPAAPTNLTATAASSSQINLSWTDNATNETNYKVERAPGGTTDFVEIVSLAVNSTTYSNTSLNASTTYTYRVKAVNTGGSSAYSNQATATTNSAATVPAISGPSTSTGSFTLTMTYAFSGTLGSTSDGYYLEESTTSPTSGFTQIQSWTNTRVTSKTYSLTKSSGTYYYRVRVYDMNHFSSYSSVIAVAVNATVPKATLHITNNTKYAMIDIRLNGTQHVTTTGSGIDIGYSYNVEFTSSGTVTYYLGVGLWDGSTRNVWFYLSGTIAVTVGSTTNLTFNNPTIAQMLSGFSSSRNWNGYYYDASYGYHTCHFNFTSSGTWTLYDGTTQVGSGSVSLVSWPNYATIITFKVCSTCANIQLGYPFGSFMYNNGPTSWPTIEYTAQ